MARAAGHFLFMLVFESSVSTLNLTNGTAEPQPAHVHKGTCANLDPAPLYPLNSVVNGKSETALGIGMAGIMGGD